MAQKLTSTTQADVENVTTRCIISSAFSQADSSPDGRPTRFQATSSIGEGMRTRSIERSSRCYRPIGRRTIPRRTQPSAPNEGRRREMQMIASIFSIRVGSGKKSKPNRQGPQRKRHHRYDVGLPRWATPGRIFTGKMGVFISFPGGALPSVTTGNTVGAEKPSGCVRTPADRRITHTCVGLTRLRFVLVVLSNPQTGA